MASGCESFSMWIWSSFVGMVSWFVGLSVSVDEDAQVVVSGSFACARIVGVFPVDVVGAGGGV